MARRAMTIQQQQQREGEDGYELYLILRQYGDKTIAMSREEEHEIEKVRNERW